MMVLDRKKVCLFALRVGTEMLADPEFADSVRDGTVKWWKPCEILTVQERKAVLSDLQETERRFAKNLKSSAA